jgi:hypothetical protein
MVDIVEEAKEVAAAEAALVVMETVKTVAQEVANVAEMVEVLFHFQYLDHLLIMQEEAEQAGLMVVEDGVLVEEQELAEEHKIQAQEVAPAQAIEALAVDLVDMFMVLAKAVAVEMALLE